VTATGRFFIGVSVPGMKADVNDLMSNTSLCRGFWSNGACRNPRMDVRDLALSHIRRPDLLMARLAQASNTYTLFGPGDTVLITVDCTDDTYRLQCRQSGLDYVGSLHSASCNVENVRWGLNINILGGDFLLRAC